MKGQWSKPITYEEDTRGGFRTIASAEEAALALLTRWPVKEGKAFFEAQRACLDVLEDKKPPDTSRAAFLKAAEEAGVFVRDQ